MDTHSRTPDLQIGQPAGKRDGDHPKEDEQKRQDVDEQTAEPALHVRHVQFAPVDRLRRHRILRNPLLVQRVLYIAVAENRLGGLLRRSVTCQWSNIQHQMVERQRTFERNKRDAHRMHHGLCAAVLHGHRLVLEARPVQAERIVSSSLIARRPHNNKCRLTRWRPLWARTDAHSPSVVRPSGDNVLLCPPAGARRRVRLAHAQSTLHFP